MFNLCFVSFWALALWSTLHKSNSSNFQLAPPLSNKKWNPPGNADFVNLLMGLTLTAWTTNVYGSYLLFDFMWIPKSFTLFVYTWAVTPSVWVQSNDWWSRCHDPQHLPAKFVVSLMHQSARPLCTCWGTSQCVLPQPYRSLPTASLSI